MPQKSRQLELPLDAPGEACRQKESVEMSTATSVSESSGATGLWEQMLAPANLFPALKRVRQNKGSSGVDGMTIDELPGYLREHWPAIKTSLETGRYRPQPVRRHMIPKPGGGERELGIPSVLDRFLQQAMLQVLQPIIDPRFSDRSFGFRPERSAHGAVRLAREFVQSGRRWVVDIDLEKFFDRVNHDILMNRLARHVEDKRILRLVRHWLEAGIMAQGLVIERHMGTPQGGPLSPLLANILLDDVDKALERRGHTFVRYADDCNVYVGSKRAGERVMAWLQRVYGALHLQVNTTKSAVAPVAGRKFLGFTFWFARGGEVRHAVAAKAKEAFRQRIRRLTRRSGGRSLDDVVARLRPYLLGWKAYFGLAATQSVFKDLDAWIRHRLRAIQLKHWKRGTRIFAELRKRGMSKTAAARVAGNPRRWWHNSKMLIHVALPNRYFDSLGLPRLAA